MTLPSPELLSLAKRLGAAWKQAPDPEYQNAIAQAVLQGLGQEPPPPDPGEILEVTSHEANGITLTFDRPTKVAPYANGDLAVLLPWPTVSFQPASITVEGRTKHGAAWNPSVSEVQGYDSTCFGAKWAEGRFSQEKNVARLGVFTARGEGTLIATKSIDLPFYRPQIQASEVLTFVAKAPPKGSFRPPYVHGPKEPWVRSSEGQWKTVALPPSGRPSIEGALAQTQGPYTGEEIPNFIKRYCHPQAQMPDYGAKISAVLGEAWLLAMDSAFSEEVREPLLTNLVQIGIDWYGVSLQAKDNHWQIGGAHAEGVLETILLAGWWLGNQDMLDIRKDRPALQFNLWGQRYRVPQSYVGTEHGYKAEHVGMPEWGNSHATNPEDDDVRWYVTGSPEEPGISLAEISKRNSVKTYRGICMPCSTGIVTALYLQGIDHLVAPDNDPTLIVDVQRRWRWEVGRRGHKGAELHYGRPWNLACWDALGPKPDPSYPLVP